MGVFGGWQGDSEAIQLLTEIRDLLKEQKTNSILNALMSSLSNDVAINASKSLNKTAADIAAALEGK